MAEPAESVKGIPSCLGEVGLLSVTRRAVRKTEEKGMNRWGSMDLNARCAFFPGYNSFSGKCPEVPKAASSHGWTRTGHDSHRVLFLCVVYVWHMYVLLFYFVCVWVFCFALTSVYHMHVWYILRPEKGDRSPRDRITDVCKPPCGC